MNYDIFISYSRGDNTQNQVGKLVEHISAQFEAFSGRPLRPFFDTKEISGGEYWQDKILKGLKESRLMLACLSPGYLTSQWCEWEFNEYQKYELSRAFLGKGMAPIYFVEVPGFGGPEFETTCAKWVTELCRRQQYDLRHWHKEGEAALEQLDVAQRLEDVTHQVWDQIRLGEAAEQRKGNLDRANERFVGRTQEMQRLHRLVGLGRVGVLTAVNGLGGMGKTALALQYAHAYGHTFAGGCWQIRCEGKTDLNEAFASLRGQRDMDYELTDEEKKSLELQFERVLKELKKRVDGAREQLLATPSRPGQERPGARVLLILDNVDQPILLADEQTCRLPQADWLCLLTTTRLGPEDLGDVSKEDFLSVDELPESDALALIESYQPKRTFPDAAQGEAAREIVRLLGGMPLAVEVAAVYMGEYRIPCTAFLARLQEDGREYFAQVEQGKKGKIRHGEKCLSITLQPTLEQLSAEERLTLEYAALLPADQVPLPWLRALVAEEFPACGQDAKIGDPDPWLDVVRRLISFRLLQETGVVDGHNFPLIVRMHRLVGEVLRQGQDGEKVEQQQVAISALTTARADFLWDHWVEREKRWEIRPLAVLSEWWMEHGETDGSNLANNLSSPLISMAHFAEARRLLLKAVVINEKALEPDHPNLATSYSNLALVEQDLGNLSEARRLLLKAVAINEKAFEAEHPTLATSYSNLATVEKDLGNLTEARRLLLKAVAIDEKAFDPEHPTLAASYSNLAMVEQDLGNLIEARRLLLKAVAIKDKAFDPEHPTLATSYSNLAVVEQDLGNLSEARRLLLKAVAIDEKAFESEHPTLARDYSNLALVEQDLGNLSEARRLLLKAVAINDKALEPEHPTLATSYSNLAMVEQDLGNLSEARRLLLKAVAIDEKAFGPEHPTLATSYSNLALVEQALGNLTEARRLLLKAVAIEEKAFEPEHPTLAVRYSNLAIVEWDLGDLAETKRLFVKSLQIIDGRRQEIDPRFRDNLRYYLNKLEQEMDPHNSIWSRLRSWWKKGKSGT